MKGQKFFLVYRNEKRETVKIQEFDCMNLAYRVMCHEEDGWSPGEIVLCSSKNEEELLRIFGEYRPRKNKVGI